MEPYLRDDLWGKSMLHRAEEFAHTIDKDGPLKIQSRVTFLMASGVSAAQTATFVAVAAIAFAARLVVVIPHHFLQFKLGGKVIVYSNDAFSKLTGSLMVTVIAALSGLSHTGLSVKAESWLSLRAAGDWNQFKTAEFLRLAKRIDSARQSKLKNINRAELYLVNKQIACRTGDGKDYLSNLYFDALANDIKSKVTALIKEADGRINNAGASPSEKYERVREAQARIGAYIRKKARKAGCLPMTYLEVGDQGLAKAEKLKGRALRFLDTQAVAVGEMERQSYPGKFDANNYYTKIGEYRSAVDIAFDSPLAKLRQKNDVLKGAWEANVSGLLQEERNIISRQKSFQRWLWWGSKVLSGAKKEEYEAEVVSLQEALATVQGRRQRAINAIHSGAFRSFQAENLRCTDHFSNHVKADGKILNQINWLVKPTISRRLWRNWLQPVLRFGPEGLCKSMEVALDPDL